MPLMQKRTGSQQGGLTPNWTSCGLSVLLCTFTWDHVSDSVPIVRALWYSSLLLALTSLSIATQQGVTLRRLSSHKEGLLFVRMLLGRPKKLQHDAVEPRLAQLYVWQTPVMLLNFSIILAVLGLAVLIVDKAEKSGWSNADMQVQSRVLQLSEAYEAESLKILAVFGSAGVFAALNYLFSTVFLYRRTLKVLE